ncbi:MAG: fibrobacter succinogenes major paralogous domain-containing protein [Bacteroidales bacterium]|jgi:uncharacterized protein (TIGR02145 family)|nr:fibrobacter succinogenes major paralogous domain-containing protein [Bacteroidales bacterium]
MFNSSNPANGHFGLIIGENPGRKLKSKEKWYSADEGNATDDYGFGVLPAGCYYNKTPHFSGRDNIASFWSSSICDIDTTCAWGRSFYYNYTPVNRFTLDRSEGLSVRCVRDI